MINENNDNLKENVKQELDQTSNDVIEKTNIDESVKDEVKESITNETKIKVDEIVVDNIKTKKMIFDFR